MALRVKELFVYPVKGCKGISVPSAALTGTGLPYDRHWMVVTEAGKFITQRQIPKLCQVSTSLSPEALLGADWGSLAPGAGLVLSAPGMPQLQVPLTNPAAADAAPAAVKQVTVWEWSGSAADEGDEAAAWFTEYLGKPARLVRHLGGAVDNSVRPTDAEFAPGHEVKFADGYPVLVTLEENLADLNARLTGSTAAAAPAAAAAAPAAAAEAPLVMRRFRPNVVLAGAEGAWCDDSWASIKVGSAALRYVKPCDRCKVTTIDPDTAEVGDEPLRALGKFRSGKALGWADERRSWTHAVFFGWNACVTQAGRVAVGDAVAVQAH